jgi:signal transduction histidine kinase
MPVRLPIRLRLTLVFALAMTVLLGATGAFLYVRLGTELLRTTDQALRDQAGLVAAGIERDDLTLKNQIDVPSSGVETFVQVLDPDGRIMDSSEAFAGIGLVSKADLASARAPLLLEREEPGVTGAVRLLVVPVRKPGVEAFVVVGSPLQERALVLSRFLWILAVAGPIAIALASVGGWALAGAALRPVDRMRREAAAISVSEPDRRLPVPDTGDEVAELGSTLNAMLDRVQESLEHERRFVAEASHELRTPLSILKAELDLALSRARSPEELGAALRSASEEADRLVALSEALLTYATADGVAPLRRTETRVDEVLRDARATFAPRAEARGVAIEVEAPAVSACVDSVRLRQAVDNVMGNAIERTPPGGCVTVRAEGVDGTVRVVFDDSGTGFAPGFVDRAFEPFARADADRASRPDGSGLGLAIARAVAVAHGGSATAENRTGGGARVTLTLQRG